MKTNQNRVIAYVGEYIRNDILPSEQHQLTCTAEFDKDQMELAEITEFPTDDMGGDMTTSCYIDGDKCILDFFLNGSHDKALFKKEIKQLEWNFNIRFDFSSYGDASENAKKIW